MKKNNNRIYLGLDPAFRKSGFAACVIHNYLASFITFRNFPEFLEWIIEYRNKQSHEIYICVENSNLDNATFDRTGRIGEQLRKSRNAGTNQAISQVAFDICKKYYTAPDFVSDIAPSLKGKKWDLKTALNVAKQEGIELTKLKPNQDERDALKMALFAKARRFWPEWHQRAPLKKLAGRTL